MLVVLLRHARAQYTVAPVHLSCGCGAYKSNSCPPLAAASIPIP
jgi:hypothetical protein